jgi:CMP-N-acetylneuraminic acid synthetase
MIAIIPVKAVSSRLPHKNIAVVHRQTLIQRAINACRQAQCIPFVSSSNDRILQMAISYGAATIKRPKYYDSTEIPGPARHTVDYLNLPDEEVFVIVQVTCPLMVPEDIHDCVSALKPGIDMTFAAIKKPDYNSFQSSDGWICAGSCLVLRAEYIRGGDYWRGNCLPVWAADQRHCDVDTKEDLERARKYLELFQTSSAPETA